MIKQQWRTWMRVLSVSMGKKTQCSATPAQEPATMCPATERPSPSSAESGRSVKPAPAYEDKSVRKSVRTILVTHLGPTKFATARPCGSRSWTAPWLTAGDAGESDCGDGVTPLSSDRTEYEEAGSEHSSLLWHMPPGGMGPTGEWAAVFAQALILFASIVPASPLRCDLDRLDGTCRKLRLLHPEYAIDGWRPSQVPR